MRSIHITISLFGKMDKQNYYTLSAFLYLLIAVAYAFTVFNNGAVIVNTWVSPDWANWAALIVSAYMSYQSFQMRK